MIFKIITFLVLAGAFTPNFEHIWYYFIIDKLLVSEFIIGVMSSISQIGILVGSIVFIQIFSKFEFTVTLILHQLFSIFEFFLNLMVASEWTSSIGISNSVSIISLEFMREMKTLSTYMLPFMTINSKVIPPDIEASGFALMTSFYNIGMTLSSLVGALICSLIGLTRDNLDPMPLAILIQIGVSLLPLLFVTLLLPSKQTVNNLQHNISHLE